MADKQITLSLPESLLERVQAAHIDLQSILLEALENKLLDRVPSLQNDSERDAYLLSLLPPERREKAQQDLAQGQRVLGLFDGQVGWMSDDFTDPLPDEFWGDLFQ